MFEKPKWIIQDGQLRMGRVEMHKELVSEDGGSVVGGGMWDFEPENKILYLYAKSFDYGQATVEDFEDIWVGPSLEDATIYFSTHMNLDVAKENSIIVQDLNEGELL